MRTPLKPHTPVYECRTWTVCLWSMNESLSSPRTAFWPQGKLSPLRKASKHAWPRCGTPQCRPSTGSHWANTFIHQPVANNGTRSMKSPPVDLLVWFAPRKDCELKVIDRLIDDPRAEACPNQVRYQWEGTPAIGEKLVFTQVYYPHSPYRARATSNNPNPNTRLRTMNCRRPPTLPAFKSSRTHLKLPCCVLNSLLVRWNGLFLIRNGTLQIEGLQSAFYTDRLRGRVNGSMQQFQCRTSH